LPFISLVTPSKTVERLGSASNLEILASALESSCVELFADYGLAIHRVETGQESPESSLLAAIDFSGAQIRGTVALRATRELIGGTNPTIDSRLPYGQLADWSCELANQLVGRIKNKLRSYGVPLSVNVPRLVDAHYVDELKNGIRHRFECRYGSFVGYLDVLIEPGFVLEGQEIEDLPQEGDLVLF
jgi:hypothetical protein